MTPEQRAFTKKRDGVFHAFMTSGLLPKNTTWGGIASDRKIAMCKQAQAELGWSVVRFNNRMQDHIANCRRKLNKRRRRGAHTDSDRTASDNESETKGSRNDDFPSFRTHAKISIVGQHGNALAHGFIIDDQPKITAEAATAFKITTNCLGQFKHIGLESIVK